MPFWSGTQCGSLGSLTACGLPEKRFWMPTWPASLLYPAPTSFPPGPIRLSWRCRGLIWRTIRYRKFSHPCCRHPGPGGPSMICSLSSPSPPFSFERLRQRSEPLLGFLAANSSPENLDRLHADPHQLELTCTPSFTSDGAHPFPRSPAGRGRAASGAVALRESML